jgi:hypothetical protein
MGKVKIVKVFDIFCSLPMFGAVCRITLRLRQNDAAPYGSETLVSLHKSLDVLKLKSMKRKTCKKCAN